MEIKSIKKNFLKYCIKNKFEKNFQQIKTLELLNKFYLKNYSSKSIISRIFKKNKKKLCFYLYGDVGVGKTMILNYFFDNLNIKKKECTLMSL